MHEPHDLKHNNNNNLEKSNQIEINSFFLIPPFSYLLFKRQFPFSCVGSLWRERLSNLTKGMVALARNPSSLPTKLSTQLKLPHIFALCFPSSASRSGHGNLYIGGGPYTRSPTKEDLSKSLLRTQLLVFAGGVVPISNEGDTYKINVTTIKVESALIKQGIGATEVRPLYPYTILGSAIFKPLVKEFTKKAEDRKIKQVTPVPPFGACFDANTVMSGAAGPDVPAIVLVLQGDVEWRMEGANAMVRVSKEVMCLGFVDSGAKGDGTIAIGGHQMEDNLLEFDVGSSTRLGSATRSSFGTPVAPIFKLLCPLCLADIRKMTSSLGVLTIVFLALCI